MGNGSIKPSKLGTWNNYNLQIRVFFPILWYQNFGKEIQNFSKISQLYPSKTNFQNYPILLLKKRQFVGKKSRIQMHPYIHTFMDEHGVQDHRHGITTNS
jgi:hypothetical protein